MRSIFVREKPRYGRRIAIALGVVVAIAAIVAGGIYLVGLLPEDVVPIAVDDSAAPVTEADQEVLAHVVFADDLPRLAIPEAAAVAAATKEFDPSELGATRVRAFLANISVPSTEQARTPIVDRNVWIVKLSGMAVPRPGSPVSEDPESPARTLSTAYVFVDAETGDIIYTEWYE